MAYTITHPDAETWDVFVNAQGGHILQTASWGKLKSAFEWQYDIIALEENGALKSGALVLYRPLPVKLGTIAYIPRGPVTNWQDPQSTTALLSAIDDAAQTKGSVLLKIEPDLWDTPQTRSLMSGHGLVESGHTVQPPNTIIIDISTGEDTILSNMSQSTRRKVRLPYRRDIDFRKGVAATAADIDSFNQLIGVTGERDEFGTHSAEYYKMAYNLFAPDHAALFLASYEGTDVAGLMAFALGDRAWYFYGASSDVERNRMQTYGIQLEAIRWAKEKGCTEYDLWGIPDADETTLEEQFQHRQDGLWGVYGFKRGFGGEVKRTLGAWDRVYKPLVYKAYQTAIKVRG